jgi:excinuclease ABC subunit A
VTYVKAFDDIRNLFAEQKLSKMRGLKAGYFSFNVPGGRCDNCEGEGILKVEMQFMADVFLECDVCHGQRYKEEALEIKFHDKNIFDILEMSIDEAIEFFSQPSDYKTITDRIILKLKPLQDVGLGYLKMGQPSSTLSGGEAQRIKLASFLVNGSNERPTLFIFDEPTTGLHFHDVNKLLAAFEALINNGHSLIVIEHDPDVIKTADWVIDLGPEGGDAGGNIVFAGTPEDLAQCRESYTAEVVVKKLR